MRGRVEDALIVREKVGAGGAPEPGGSLTRWRLLSRAATLHDVRHLASALLLLFAAACGKSRLGSTDWNTALTPETHTPFPIVAAPHAIECNACHETWQDVYDLTAVKHDSADSFSLPDPAVLIEQRSCATTYTASDDVNVVLVN